MHPTYTSKFPELGFYGLPGHSRSPRDILRQAQDAEALGIGNIMISERADYKEISALCGAVAAVTEKLYIGTSGTNLNTRHPVITASMGSTLNSLSEGRFALGLAKGVALRWKAMNVDFPSFEREREFISLMRKLWHGEQVSATKASWASTRLYNWRHTSTRTSRCCTSASALRVWNTQASCITARICTRL